MGKRGGPARPLGDILKAIIKEERCGIETALMAFSINAVLAGMSRVPACRNGVVLKGGSALRLLLEHSIGRISTDIDLSIQADEQVPPIVFTGEVARETANVLAEHFADPASIRIELHQDRESPAHPHMPRMRKWRLHAQYEKTRAETNAFLVELTLDEYVDLDHTIDLQRTVYGMPIALRAYAPLQSIAEKLRAILQKHEKFDRNKDATNFEPRHVTDLVALHARLNVGDLEALPALFHRKCDVRHIPPELRTRERFMHPQLAERVAKEQTKLCLPTDPWELLGQLADRVCR